MNYLKTLSSLRNRYFCMRHGQSVANEKGLIISSPENGVSAYGLSATGRTQVKHVVSTEEELTTITQIVSSDFKRARESAEIIHELHVGKHKVIFSKELRERNFGAFELSSNSNYQTVWDRDAIDSSHTKNNVESADAVMKRATSLLMLLEKDFSGQSFLFVSHGDTLQILQTAFLKQEASTHRDVPHLGTAELRALILAA